MIVSFVKFFLFTQVILIQLVTHVKCAKKTLYTDAVKRVIQESSMQDLIENVASLLEEKDRVIEDLRDALLIARMK